MSLEITLRPTRQLVDLETREGTILGRVWVGKSAAGVELQAIIVRVAAHKEADQTQLESELISLPELPPDDPAFPPRMTI